MQFAATEKPYKVHQVIFTSLTGGKHQQEFLRGTYSSSVQQEKEKYVIIEMCHHQDVKGHFLTIVATQKASSCDILFPKS